MAIPKVFESEYRMCLILWENEPIRSAELAELCKEQLGWSRTTTYTVIRRLSDRGVLQNNKTIVSSLIPKEDVQLQEMNELMEKTFENDLTAFVAAFARQQKLSGKDVAELKQLLEQYEASV
ncbi:MAG: BlaI/MecI/CopY family transcriptional regulator [Clostridia bacterium]|nr:BlaI/MecI/CopY family transcriptional regulator [Clostridia bacterium]